MAKEKEGEVTPEVKTESVVETPPEVSIEDLQTQIQEKDTKIQEQDAKILEQQRTVSKHADRERKLGDQSEAMAAISRRMDISDEERATMLDYLEELRGQPAEEAKAPLRSHRAELEERRKARGGEKITPSVDPSVQSFLSYCDDVDLHIDTDSFEGCDPLVKEALGEGRGFRGGLKYLKTKIKTKDAEKTKKDAEEIAKGLVEQKLKDLGLTASEASGPSAAETSFEKVRDAYIHNPNDPAIAREYLRLRQKQGI